MSMSRKKALERMESLAPRIEEHLRIISAKHSSVSLNHWKMEIRGWIRQIERIVHHTGIRTELKWKERIEDWKMRLGDESDEIDEWN